ncbi:MAG: DTW domain-containing protein [Comamonadaceae bacterium]|nr:MAG: DTW domain-containing protein [Comamonadaceae bacterium]
MRLMEEKHRARCAGCGLLSAQCVCAHIAPIDNVTPVRVLQHPNEARHALNTARWVVAGLRQAQLISKPCFTIEDWCVPGHEPVLLYPADAHADATADALDVRADADADANAVDVRGDAGAAVDVAAAVVDEPLPHHRSDSDAHRVPCSLVVIDGTWKQAAAILRMHPELLALRRIALPAHLGSAYRLRKSPRPDGLSTVEAVVAALDVLDAPTSHAAVLHPFLAQIDQQIAQQRVRMGEQAFRHNYPDL